MENLNATSKEASNAKWTFIFSLTGTLLICFTICFSFFKINQTATETERITEQTIRLKDADTRNILAHEGKLAEYRPQLLSYRTVALNTAYQPSTARITDVAIDARFVCTATLIGGQDGTLSIQVCSTQFGTYQTTHTVECGNSVSLAIALTAINTQQGPLKGKVAKGYWYKIVAVNINGLPTMTLPLPAEEEQE